MFFNLDGDVSDEIKLGEKVRYPTAKYSSFTVTNNGENNEIQVEAAVKGKKNEVDIMSISEATQAGIPLTIHYKAKTRTRAPKTAK